MRKCLCSGIMKGLRAETADGVEYKYFKCVKCGEEILNMQQLHQVAQKYREMKRYSVKLSKWGESIGLRIPKALTKKYNFREDVSVDLVPEDKGVRIIPA